MLVQVLDAESAPHFVAWQGQDQINDGSGALAAGAVGNAPTPQLIAAANQARAGFLFQNASQQAMLLFEAGNTVAGWVVLPFQFFPPNGNYPIPSGALYAAGTAASQIGDAFVYREWEDAVGE
jgi:hypothetical protein